MSGRFFVVVRRQSIVRSRSGLFDSGRKDSLVGMCRYWRLCCGVGGVGGDAGEADRDDGDCGDGSWWG